MINSFSFGKMGIGGRVYRKDLILLPDGSIFYPWRREKGHSLTAADLGPVLEARPEILVVGTGAFGLMKPDAGLESDLAEKGIAVKIMPTKQAVSEYNDLAKAGAKVAACFHLTC